MLVPFNALLLLVASVSAGPLDIFKRQAAGCPGHSAVYNALKSYSSSASFCSAELGIQPTTVTVISTSTRTLLSTTTVKIGTVASVKSSATSISISTITQISLATITTSVSGKVITTTRLTTITAASGVPLAACAVSAAVVHKRDAAIVEVKIAGVSTPTQLARYGNAQLVAGCQCLDFPTSTMTTTQAGAVTVTSIFTSAIPSTTVVPGLGAVSVSTTIIVVASTITLTSGVAASAVTVDSTTTVSNAAGASTPSSFYLKSSNGNYVSLASLAGGGFYNNLPTSSGADLFAFNSANQLIVVTTGSHYQGYIAVGTMPGADMAYDWMPLKVTKTGASATRPALCCAMTSNNLLTCGGGEIFGDCYMHGVFEGPIAAVTASYDFEGFGCSNITLSIVTS